MEQEAFDRRAGLHFQGIRAGLSCDLLAVYGEQPAVRAIFCHKQHKRIGLIIAAGRDGQRVALQRGRGLCAQVQRTAGEEHERVRIVRGEIRAVILLPVRKQHGVRSVGADAELCAVCQFTGDREQGRGAVDTDIDVVGLAASGVARDDGRTLNVHPAARFGVDTAAETGGRVAGDCAAIEVQRAARFDVDRAAIAGIDVVILNCAAENVDNAAGLDVNRAALAVCDVVAGDLAAVKVQCAVLVNDDRAAGRGRAAGERDVVDRERAVLHIRDTAGAACDCAADDLAGFAAIGKHQRRTANEIDLVVAGADDMYGLVVQAEVERLVLTENQLCVDVGLRIGKIAGGCPSGRDR